MASLMFSAVAAAQTGPSAEDVKAAAAEFDQGKASFKKRAWVEAAEHFEGADTRAPSAVALSLALRARDKAGQLDRAGSLAALALERHADQADLVKEARAVLERARAELHEVKVRCTPACELVIGTKLVHGGASESRTLFVLPGGVAVHASWPGNRARSAPVKAVKGGASEVAFEAPAEPAREDDTKPSGTSKPPPPVTVVTPPPKDTGTEPDSGLPPVVFWIGAGLTAVAGGVTVWSGLDTQNNPGPDRVRQECAGQGESCDLYQDGLSRQRRTNILLGVTGGLAVATGVVGAFFTRWGGGSKGARSAALRSRRVAVEPLLGLGSLGARGSF